MTRSVPGSILKQFGARHLKLARCVKIVTKDDAVFTFTDLDEDVVVADHAQTGASATYEAGRGVMPTDISMGTGLETGSTELIIPIGTVTKNDVITKRFVDAEVWVFDIDHSEEFSEPNPLMRGTITEARLEESRAIFEVRDLNDIWNATVGSILSPRCRADFGDEQCGAEVEEAVGVISAVTSTMEFRLSIAGHYADQYFRFGEIAFTSGALANLPAKEIVQYKGSTGAVELFDPLPAMPAVNDEFVIRRGCSRLKSSTDATIPTCLSYDNVLRFRGFDRVPGSDVYLKIAVPGDAGA